MTNDGKIAVMALALFMMLVACDKLSGVNKQSFVGKWQSTRMVTTPVFLMDNGEWEIRNDSGKAMQYGTWDYKDSQIIWYYQSGKEMIRDPNKVLSMKPGEFKLKEQDGSITTFSRLD